jgi:hypothetical protein
MRHRHRALSAELPRGIDQTSLAPNSLEAGHAISDRIGNPRSKFQRKNSERLAGHHLTFLMADRLRKLLKISHNSSDLPGL